MGRLNNQHYASENCKQGEERRLQLETLQHCFDASRVLLQINAEDLPLLEAFPYFGRTITYKNRNYTMVYQKLRIAQGRWRMIARMLENAESVVRSWGMMYKAVAQ